MRFWHALHALRLGSGNAPVTCEDATVLVNDDGIDEAELAQTAAQLVDLLRRMRPCVVRVWNEFTDWNELHLACCFVQNLAS